MSKLMENKQMLHIVSEVVVLLGLTFYFNQKNKKMMGHIEDLAQRVEEQEDLLQKHEQIIRKLVDFINTLPPSNNGNSAGVPTGVPTDSEVQQIVNQTPSQVPTKTNKRKPAHKQVHKQVHKEPPMQTPAQSAPPSQPRVRFGTPQQQTYQEEVYTDSDSDLDAELVEELEELNEVEEVEEFDTELSHQTDTGQW